jgi:hypothetical protein
MRPATATHKCAAVACQRQVPMRLLMCIDHWRRVPAALRRQVWASYRRTDAEAGLAYLAAVQAAVDAVHTKALAQQVRRDPATPDLFG